MATLKERFVKQAVETERAQYAQSRQALQLHISRFCESLPERLESAAKALEGRTDKTTVGYALDNLEMYMTFGVYIGRSGILEIPAIRMIGEYCANTEVDACVKIAVKRLEAPNQMGDTMGIKITINPFESYKDSVILWPEQKASPIAPAPR